MKLQSVFDKEFIPYGKVVAGYDLAPLVALLESATPKPHSGTVYVAGDPALEALEVAQVLGNHMYGGMPIQVGYCNGNNTVLNCLEYHRDSEVNVAADDVILLVAQQQKIVDGKLHTREVEAFLLPKGTAAELYATTLHYAPCNAKAGEGFRVAIVLPKGTNTAKPNIPALCAEDAMLTACNKWLLAHPDSNEAKQGAVVGLEGENISIAGII